MDKKISEIINDWNPIEIYPLLQDEYQYETKRIEDRIKDCQSIQTLTELIYSVFKDSFGGQFTKTNEDCKEIARKIL